MTNSLRKMIADKVVIASVGFESDEERDRVNAGIKNAMIGVGFKQPMKVETVEHGADVMPDEWGKVPVAEPVNVDLLGTRVYAPAIPARQLALFDKADFTRTYPTIPAVVLRENGEKAIGAIDPRISKALTFTANDSGKQYTIPLACCNVTWVGEDKAVIVDIAERDLKQHVSWYGMFASCRLF